MEKNALVDSGLLVKDLPNDLKNRLSDFGPSLFAMVSGFTALGPIGAAIAEVVPTQRLDRVAIYVRRVELELTGKIAAIEEEIRAQAAPERAKLLLDGAQSAANATSDARARQIALIAGRGVSGSEVHAQKARTLLSVVNSLTDVELAVLEYFAAAGDRRRVDGDTASLAEQLADSPGLKAIFGDDVQFWVATISKLTSAGLIRDGGFWGGTFETDQSPEQSDAHDYSPLHFVVTTLGALVCAALLDDNLAVGPAS